MERKTAGLVCVCLVAALTSGCVMQRTPFNDQVRPNFRFNMGIDAIAAPDAHAKGKAYMLSSGLKDVAEDDLQFQEFARYVENVLSKKGYHRVDTDEKADLLIRLSYGIGNPQTTTTTYVTSYGYSYPVGWMWYSVPPEVATRQVTNYCISMVLDAYDLKTPGRRSQLWKTTVTSNSRVPNNEEGGIFVVTYYDITDLRIQVPYMIAAAGDYFGTNTGRTVNALILGGDPRVFEVMGIEVEQEEQW